MTLNSAAAPSGPLSSKKLQIAVAVAEPASVCALFIFLLWKTWLRWPDPLVDFPRDLYMAWRISQGDLPYTQLANWYGPLAQLIEAAGFRIFGVGLTTLVWMNVVLTAAVLLLLRNILGLLGNRLMVWLGSVVFLVVFAFGDYVSTSNYNFITPYSAQATYGFAGLLLVLWGLLHHLRSNQSRWLAVAGIGLAVAYLDKHEPTLAAIGTISFYLLVQIVRVARTSSPANADSANPPSTDWRSAAGWFIRSVAWLAGGFLCMAVPVFIYLMACGGMSYAVSATNRVSFTLVGQSFVSTVMNSPSMRQFFGFDLPRDNFIIQLKSGALLVLVCVMMAMAARAWARTCPHGAKWWALLLLVIGVGGGVGFAELFTNGWFEIGRSLIFPVMLLAGGAAIWSLSTAWRREAEFTRAANLAIFGIAASLMLGRMVFFGRIYQFGFFMAPLGVLFFIHCVVVETAGRQPAGQRRNWLLPTAFSLLVLAGVVELGLGSNRNFNAKTYEVSSGPDHFYALPPTSSPDGALLNTMLSMYRQFTPTAKTVVAFPEGIAVNYHLRVPSSVAETEFQPVSLAYVGPAHVLAELKAHPPEVIFLHYRDMSEYGLKYFGDGEAGGHDIVQWINDNYDELAYGNHDENNKTITGHVLDMYVPKAHPATSGPNADSVSLTSAKK